jgi:hypothetical protein
MVHVSARVRTFQDAYQLGGLVVLPLVLLMVGQFSGLIYFGTVLVAVLGLVVWLIAGLLLWVGIRRWRREALITQL